MVLKLPSQTLIFRGLFSKNDVFWLLYFSGRFRGVQLWFKWRLSIIIFTGKKVCGWDWMGSEVSRGCLIFYTTFLYQFCGNYNYSFLSAKKCLKMLKSTLGQNNLSLEVLYKTVTQFFGFFGGSIWVSDHCAPPPFN